jgi:hypothetical protein
MAAAVLTGDEGSQLSQAGDCPRMASTSVLHLAANVVARPISLLAVLIVGALGFYLTTTLHHDVSWYLVATDRLLSGARLYVDIVEVNPPLAFYLTIPPVALARLLGVSTGATFVGYVFVLIAGSLLIVHRLLEDRAAPSPRYRFVMLLAGVTTLTVAPIGVFGQREHLMLIFALPYLFLLERRIAGHRCHPLFTGLIGVLAVAGFGLKPHFLLVPVGLELYLLIQRRSLRALWRPETWSLGLGLVSYAVLVAFLHPEYIDFIIPNGFLVYDAYSTSLQHVLFKPAVFTILPAVILYAVARVSGTAGSTADAFVIATIGFFVAYATQSKGWTYQMIPAIAAGCLTAAAIAAGVLKERPDGRGRTSRLLLLTTAGLAMATPMLMLLAGGAYHNPFAEKVLADAKKYAGNGTVYSFTSHVWVSFPLVNHADAQWASRFPTQWLLPGALRRLAEPSAVDAETEQRLREIERYAANAVVEDLERTPPDLVIVDKQNPYFDKLDFDFLSYFSHEPRFVAFWRPYVKVKVISLTIGGQRRDFEIWCRQDSSSRCSS